MPLRGLFHFKFLAMLIAAKEYTVFYAMSICVSPTHATPTQESEVEF